MSKTRQVAKNLSRIVKNDAITLKDDSILFSKNANLSNENLNTELINGQDSTVIANSIYEFKNEYIGTTLSLSSPKFNYIILSPVLAGAFIIDGEFLIESLDGSVRTFKVCANIGVASTVLSRMDGGISNEFETYLTYNNATQIAIQINTEKSSKVFFSGFISTSNNLNPLSITSSDYVSNISAIMQNIDVTELKSNPKWSKIDSLNMLTIHKMQGMTTLNDGNIFYLEMCYFDTNSTAGNNTGSGVGYTNAIKNINRAWIINPYTMEKRETSRFPWYPIKGARCVTIYDGSVLVFFGSTSSNISIADNSTKPSGYSSGMARYSKYVYRYSPSTELWSIETIAPNGLGWDSYGASLNEDKTKVVLMGGSLEAIANPTDPTVETIRAFFKYPYIYDIKKRTWTQAGKTGNGYQLSPGVNNFFPTIAHLSGSKFLVCTFNFLSWSGTTSTTKYDTPQTWVWDMDSYQFIATSNITGKAGNGVNPLNTICPNLIKLDENKVAIIGGWPTGTAIYEGSVIYNTGRTVTSMTVYDYSTNSYTGLTIAPIGVSGLSPATKLLDGRIFIGQSALVPLLSSSSTSNAYYTSSTTGAAQFIYDNKKFIKDSSSTWNTIAIIPSSAIDVFDSTTDKANGNGTPPSPNDMNWIPFPFDVSSANDIYFGGYYTSFNGNGCHSMRYYSLARNTGTLTRIANSLMKGAQVAGIAFDSDTFIQLGGYGLDIPSPATFSSDSISRKPFKYNKSTNTWTEINLDYEAFDGNVLSDFTAVTYNNEIYYGFSNVRNATYPTTNANFRRAFYKYNPTTNTLTKLSDAPYNGITKSILDKDNGRIYFVEVNPSAPRNMVYYNISTNTWVTTNIEIPVNIYHGGKIKSGKLYLFSNTTLYKINLSTGGFSTIAHPLSYVDGFSSTVIIRIAPTPDEIIIMFIYKDTSGVRKSLIMNYIE